MNSIYWVFGNTGAGKTTMAESLVEGLKAKGEQVVWLDGDTMRGVWSDLDLSKEGRYENNMRIVRLVSALYNQGNTVVVSTICPYQSLRDDISKILCKSNLRWVYLPGGKEGKAFPFEIPKK